MSWTIGRAGPGDRAAIVRLLIGCGLPVEDLVGAWHGSFLVARANGALIGAAALETQGTVGLVRSLATSPDWRDRGVASALLEALETRAVEHGLAAAYALTLTAEAFLANRGYETIPRSTVPEAIRDTTEFRELCPETAVCLRKRLGGSGRPRVT